MGTYSDLVIPVDPDPPEAPPQRGFIDPRHAWHVRAVLQVARVLGEKVLNIENALEQNVERTPDREQKVASAVKLMAERGQLKLGDYALDEFGALVAAELFGLGPLDRFLDSPDVSEIMVNGPYVLFIERKGKLTETGHKFLDDEHVERIIRRITSRIGRTVGPDSPLVDARLPDGSRVNAAVAPCTLDGPSLTIRKFSRRKLTLNDLMNFGAMSPNMGEFLSAIVKARRNIVVAGGTGSGKTTLINALSHHIPNGERVVTIEDAAELQLSQRNVVRMESKKPTFDNPAQVTIRDCLVNALRMRPERILIGECRSSEALDMLQAMNTGHDGSMTTVHANTPRDTVSRLETLALMSGIDLPVSVIRKQIASAVHFIVQVSRLRDGSRRITHITEVQGMEGEIVVLGDIFLFVEEGMRGDKIVGKYKGGGNRPKCIEDIERHGIRLAPQMFFG
ncbi:MAG: CpaF family protein [Myxococcota bacterium]